MFIALMAMPAMGATPAAAAQKAPEVLVVARDPMHAMAKMGLMKECAQLSGIRFRFVFAATLKDDDYPGLYSGADLVMLDVGNRSLAQVIHSKAAAGNNIPVVPILYEGFDDSMRRGISRPMHERLQAYYDNGGRSNFENLFRYLATELFHVSTIKAADPVIIPQNGYYHPQMPGELTSDLQKYLKWKNHAADSKKPVIALLFSRASIENGSLKIYDEMISRIEQAGALPLPFFFVDRPGQSSAIRRMLTSNNRVFANVIINTVPPHAAAERKVEFETIGIPVLGALRYRPGTPQDWQKSVVGLQMSAIPSSYATPEMVGIVDPMLMATEERNRQAVLLPDQFDALINKALKLTRLQQLPNADKKVTIFFYNNPTGEKNLSASNLNIPQSIASILKELKAAGYSTDTEDEKAIITKAQRVLAPFYRDGKLEELLRDGLAETFPVAAYSKWLETLPAQTRNWISARWGAADKSSMVISRNGEKLFVIPRAMFGKIAVTRQAPRGDRIDDREKAIYHDTKVPPNHYYLASYLWARSAFKSDAFIHLGTHGTQEWLPGKERGLSIYDAPNLAVGDVPVVYPYIVANIGEAIQAKRRGRAVIISHQTPPYAPSGLYDELLALHDLVHQYADIETESVREKVRKDIVNRVIKGHFHKDMGWDDKQIAADFKGFLDAFHNHLHALADTVQPLGLHSFGVTPQTEHRVFTVMQMLGKPYLEAVLGKNSSEVMATDYKGLKEIKPYRLLYSHLVQGEALPADTSKQLQAMLQKARQYYDNFEAARETKGLLTALNGRHVPSSTGDDPIRNPASHPTGRNMYGFDPAKVPSKQAWEVGKEAMNSLIEQYRKKHGRMPEKLAFNLWSGETMRQHGVVEAQLFYAMGVKPVWDEGGRVTATEIIPAKELGRPRIDVVVTASGLYRDMLPIALKKIEDAVKQVAALDETGNAVRANTQKIEKILLQNGAPPKQAKALAQARIFSNASGDYGLKLDDATLASDSWGETGKGKQDRKAGEAKLAELYMGRMGHIWGEDGDKGLNRDLFAENLKKVDAAVLARSSNVFGVVNTDDPFQYLGGISTAVRSLTGKTPELYISDLRTPGKGKTETAANFIAAEMRTRYFHPNWVAEMKKEGYSGTVEMVKVANNFWGWQAVAPETVRADQWQEMADVYVHDKHKLGMKEWFEKENPHAQAQMIERMLEAVRKEYWDAPAETVKELKERYRQLAGKYDVISENKAFREFVDAGYGLDASAAAPANTAKSASKPSSSKAAKANSAPAPTAAPQIRGMQLTKVEPPPAGKAPPLDLIWLTPLVAMAAGSGRQFYNGSRNTKTRRH